MIQLSNSGAYLINGTELVYDNADAAAIIAQKTLPRPSIRRDNVRFPVKRTSSKFIPILVNRRTPTMILVRITSAST